MAPVKTYALEPVTCAITGGRLLIRPDQFDPAKHVKGDPGPAQPAPVADPVASEAAPMSVGPTGASTGAAPTRGAAPHPALESDEAFKAASANDAIAAVQLVPADLLPLLDDLARAEREGKHRVTVLQAIEARRKVLAAG